MSERRQKPRKTTNDYYIIYDQDTEEVIGRVVDLSTGGAMLITDEPIESKQICHCRMALPDFIMGRRFISFDIEGKWCQFNRISNWYEIGCEFVNSTPELEEFVEYLIQHWPPKREAKVRRPTP